MSWRCIPCQAIENGEVHGCSCGIGVLSCWKLQLQHTPCIYQILRSWSLIIYRFSGGQIEMEKWIDHDGTTTKYTRDSTITKYTRDSCKAVAVHYQSLNMYKRNGSYRRDSELTHPCTVRGRHSRCIFSKCDWNLIECCLVKPVTERGYCREHFACCSSCRLHELTRVFPMWGGLSHRVFPSIGFFLGGWAANPPPKYSEHTFSTVLLAQPACCCLLMYGLIDYYLVSCIIIFIL